MNKFLNNYIISSSIVCGVMKFFELKDAKVKRDTDKITNMLNVEKSYIILFNTIFGAYILPTKLYSKSIDFEIYMKKKDKSKFFLNKDAKDLILYLF